MNKKLLYLLLIAFTITSCKKESNIKIVGKWKLTEVFFGYANGGNFQWNNVTNENSHTLKFSDNGQYVRQENQNGNNNQCIGTYQLQPDNILEINSTCNTVTEKMKISELASSLLIIDRQGIEGIIRYKYVATN